MSFVSFSRLSTSRTRRSSSQSTTSPWTWWRSPTLKRPSRWSVIRTTSSPCISTPRCLMTWRCRRPRERTLCRARWDRQLLSRFLMPLLVKKWEFFLQKSMCVFVTERISLWPELPARCSLDRHRGSADRRLHEGHRPHQWCRTSPFSICLVYIQQFLLILPIWKTRS